MGVDWFCLFIWHMVLVKAVKLQKLLHGYFHSEKSDAGLLETPEVSLLLLVIIIAAIFE